MRGESPYCRADRRYSVGGRVDDDRLIDIETKLAHQEHMLAELNDVITEQSVRLGHLEELCQRLAERLRTLGDGAGANGGGPDDERPPHY